MATPFITADTSWLSILGLVAYFIYQIYSTIKSNKKKAAERNTTPQPDLEPTQPPSRADTNRRPMNDPMAEPDTFTRRGDRKPETSQSQKRDSQRRKDVKTEADLEELLRSLNKEHKSEVIVDKKEDSRSTGSSLMKDYKEIKVREGTAILRPKEDEEAAIIRQNKETYDKMVRERKFKIESYSRPIATSIGGRFDESQNTNKKARQYKKLLKSKGSLKRAIMLNEILKRPTF